MTLTSFLITAVAGGSLGLGILWILQRQARKQVELELMQPTRTREVLQMREELRKLHSDRAILIDDYKAKREAYEKARNNPSSPDGNDGSGKGK